MFFGFGGCWGVVSCFGVGVCFFVFFVFWGVGVMFWVFRCCIRARASRAMLCAAARCAKSAATLARPRTRAWRPPCFRRMRWPILRSTLGLVLVYSFCQAGSFWRWRASVSMASLGPMLILLPVLDLVHWLRSGHPSQAEPKLTIVSLFLFSGFLVGNSTVISAGHVTVPCFKLMLKSLLENVPLRLPVLGFCRTI